MSVNLAPAPVFQGLGFGGLPLPGGKLYTYIAGTSSPQATYTDYTGSVPNTNPVILNANGQASVWLTIGQTYKLALTDALGNQVWSQDQILGGATITQAIFNSFLSTITFNGGATDSITTDVYVHRTAAYSGGSAGFVNTAFTVQDDVTGAASVADEWAFLAIMNNSSTNGENVAGYMQGNRVTAGTGPTWASVIEARELVAIANPTTALTSLEIDNRSNGTDANFNRVGIALIAARYNTSGAATTLGIGIYICNDSDGANTSIGNGIFFGNKAGGTCNFANGLNMVNGQYSESAILLPQGAPIAFDAAGSNQFAYNGGGLDYKASGTIQTRLLPTGGVGVNNSGTIQQIIAQRISGWGTSSGGTRGAITGASTLAQVAAGLSQLLTDLQTHGLLGT